MTIADRPPFLARAYHDVRERFSIIGRLNRQKELARQFALPSTVSIETILRPNKHPQGTEVEAEVGAGFVIEAIPSRGGRPAEVLIATNRHVVEDAVVQGDRLMEFHVVTSGADGATGAQGEKQVFSGGHVVYMSDKHDVAFVRLSLEENPGLKMPALKTGYSVLVDTPDTLLTIGAPLGAQDTVTELQLSQYNLTKICMGDNCDKYRQISNANPGNSGGPVIDPVYAGNFGAKPRVVGMVTLGADGNSSQGYMLPIEVVNAELAEYHRREEAKTTNLHRRGVFNRLAA